VDVIQYNDTRTSLGSLCYRRETLGPAVICGNALTAMMTTPPLSANRYFRITNLVRPASASSRVPRLRYVIEVME
jgi:hypothetical protein